MSKISKELLDGLGLSEAQARVYLAALELGQATMQELARKSGVKRTSIYNFLGELKAKQLIVETKKKKRILYSAAHPERLIQMEETRLEELQKTLPELLAIHNQQRKKPRVTFYEGLDGIKEIYADTLREKKNIIGWSDYEQSRNMLGSFYYTYAEERAKKNILYQVIARDTPAAREKAEKKFRELRDIKLIESKDLTTEIYIYNNKVAHINFRSKPPFAVLIEDADIAETLRVAWHQLWDKLEN